MIKWFLENGTEIAADDLNGREVRIYKVGRKLVKYQLHAEHASDFVRSYCQVNKTQIIEIINDYRSGYNQDASLHER